MRTRTREEIIGILKKAKSGLKKSFKVRRIGLFGSYARGDQKPESDLDILVDVDPTIGLGFVTLADELERSIGIHIDLVSLRAIPARKIKIIKEDLIYV
jgi:predicted nucleotidyltransferase